jgi:undecaprenyl phosphate-alpha-L-ara4N flippase subunit ArnE
MKPAMDFWRIGLGTALMIALTVTANIMMKIGASVPAVERPIFGIAWQSCLGVSAFGGAAVIYAWILQWLPLNVAQSFTSLQFVAVILAATLILGEPISAARWVGIGLIAVGIVVVSLSGEIFLSGTSI